MVSNHFRSPNFRSSLTDVWWAMEPLSLQVVLPCSLNFTSDRTVLAPPSKSHCDHAARVSDTISQYHAKSCRHENRACLKHFDLFAVIQVETTWNLWHQPCEDHPLKNSGTSPLNFNLRLVNHPLYRSSEAVPLAVEDNRFHTRVRVIRPSPVRSCG